MQESGAGQSLATVSPRRPADDRLGAARLPPVHGHRDPQRCRSGDVDRVHRGHHRRPARRAAGIVGHVTGSETTNDATDHRQLECRRTRTARRSSTTRSQAKTPTAARPRPSPAPSASYTVTCPHPLLQPRPGHRVGHGDQRQGHRPGRPRDADLRRPDRPGCRPAGTQLVSERQHAPGRRLLEGLGTTTLEHEPARRLGVVQGTCTWTHTGNQARSPTRVPLRRRQRCRSRSTPATSTTRAAGTVRTTRSSSPPPTARLGRPAPDVRLDHDPAAAVRRVLPVTQRRTHVTDPGGPP